MINGKLNTDFSVNLPLQSFRYQALVINGKKVNLRECFNCSIYQLFHVFAQLLRPGVKQSIVVKLKRRKSELDHEKLLVQIRQNPTPSLTCTEKTYFEIAKEMFVSEGTIDGYRDSLFKN